MSKSTNSVLSRQLVEACKINDYDTAKNLILDGADWFTLIKEACERAGECLLVDSFLKKTTNPTILEFVKHYYKEDYHQRMCEALSSSNYDLYSSEFKDLETNINANEEDGSDDGSDDGSNPWLNLIDILSRMAEEGGM